jgi:putative addiction module antidote
MNNAKLKIRAIGNSYGVTLPKEIIDALGVSKGDELHLAKHGDAYLITPFNPSFDAKLKAFEDFRRNYRNSLRNLAQ